jgi:hypothetical protein
VDSSGWLQIDCNGEGVRFLVARADCTGEDLFRDYKPSPEIRRMFVPSGDTPCLAMFQVTHELTQFYRTIDSTVNKITVRQVLAIISQL